MDENGGITSNSQFKCFNFQCRTENCVKFYFCIRICQGAVNSWNLDPHRGTKIPSEVILSTQIKATCPKKYDFLLHSGGVLRGRVGAGVMVDVDASTTETESMLSSSRQDYYEDDESTITSVSQIANCESLVSIKQN